MMSGLISPMNAVYVLAITSPLSTCTVTPPDVGVVTANLPTSYSLSPSFSERYRRMYSIGNAVDTGFVMCSCTLLARSPLVRVTATSFDGIDSPCGLQNVTRYLYTPAPCLPNSPVVPTRSLAAVNARVPTAGALKLDAFMFNGRVLLRKIFGLNSTSPP
ncbi:hypothetical protein D3C78_1457780 [compost metagenome]